MAKGVELLQALLSEGGRELVNIKFFPGNGRAATASQLAEAACELLRGEIVDNPPVSGVAKASI